MKRMLLLICISALLFSGCANSVYGTGPIVPLGDDRIVYDQDLPEVLTLNVKIMPGGATIEEVNSDEDKDAPQHTAIVQISEPGYVFDDGQSTASGTLEIRGSSSRLAAQKSYSIRLDGDTIYWRTLRILDLNKQPYDLTRMRNKLSFDYFETIPNMASLRTQFIHLYIDGVDYGLYTLIERCNKLFLRQHGFDRNGNLYKAENFEFKRYGDVLVNVNDPNYDKTKFEKILTIRGREDDHTKLIQMLEDVNNWELDINVVMKKHFQRDNYLTWFAINIITDNEDTNSQNFFLYSPTTSQGWYFMGWDYDGGWDFWGQPIQQQNTKQRWKNGISNWWNDTLHKRFIMDKNNLQDLITKVQDLSSNVFTTAQTKSYLNSYRNMATSIITSQPDLAHLPTVAVDDAGKIAEFNAEVDRLPGTTETSYQTFMNTLERPMPVFLGVPEIFNGKILFLWDESYDLQGDNFTYDFQISTDPAFADNNIVYQRLGMTINLIEIDLLPAGTYYYRVIIRDTKDPTNNWQLPFDHYNDGITDYDGIKQFTI